MLRLRTFGGLSLESDAGPLSAAATQRKRLAALALLAAARPDRGLSRDQLAAYLWPESETDRARHGLAQLVYALRRELGDDEVITGTAELRLNPRLVESDVARFEEALERGDHEAAARLYAGPFLDGMYLTDAPEFERWAERERARLAQLAASALGTLATDADERGDHSAAVEWWRRLAALDPLSVRGALGLMAALEAAGDRAGALQHARVYDTLVRAELEVEPDPAVAAFAEQLRTLPDPAVAAFGERRRAPSEVSPAAARGALEPAARRATPFELFPRDAATLPPAGASRPGSRTGRWLIAATMLVLVAAVMAVALRPRDGLPTVIAVGAIQNYGAADTAGLSRAIGDMLSTNLARVPTLQVVSNARVYDLLGQSGERDSSPTAVATAMAKAAARAGATEVVEGALYHQRGGALRFDLRRVALTTGAVRASYSVEGSDAFVLVDRATAQLAADFHARGDTLNVADVTTTSLAAYRLYQQGLEALYRRNDARDAYRLFSSALAEDSTFAMAAYQAGQMARMLSAPDAERLMLQARRMADRAPDRERLMILAIWYLQHDEPAGRAVAETLAIRYPTEPAGQYAFAHALLQDGQPLRAVPYLRRAIAMDSLSLRGATARCPACDAYHLLIGVYGAADSLDAAERTAREYVRVRPNSPSPWGELAGVLDTRHQYDSARAVLTRIDRMQPDASPWNTFVRVQTALRAGDFAEGDRLLHSLAQGADADARSQAAWFRIIALRYQGRLAEALALAQRYRERVGGPLLQAVALQESGRARAAAALYDSIAASPPWAPQYGAKIARHRAWHLTHAASALSAAGDTARLERLADSVEAIGAQSAFGRDHRLHHHVRGLLMVARDRLPDAERELRAAVYSPTVGYTRTNLELGRVLLRLGRPREAVAVLRPALCGPLDSSNLYVTHTELHELLAQAFEADGERDSARVHYAWVAGAWKSADPPLRARRDAAARRAVALVGGGARRPGA